MGTKVKETIQTPKGVFGFCYLTKPDTSPKGKNKYKTTLILDKGVEANDAFAQKLNDLHKSVKGKRDKAPAKDGDRFLADAEDKEQADKREYARGKWLITAKTNQQPRFVAANGKSALAVPPGRGDFGRMLVFATDYDVDNTTGVSCYLNGVQLLERRAAPMDEGGFDDESGEYGEDNAKAPTPDSTDDDGRPTPDADDDGDY